jgi:hypothetical protein
LAGRAFSAGERGVLRGAFFLSDHLQSGLVMSVLAFKVRVSLSHPHWGRGRGGSCKGAFFLSDHLQSGLVMSVLAFKVRPQFKSCHIKSYQVMAEGRLCN